MSDQVWASLISAGGGILAVAVSTYFNLRKAQAVHATAKRDLVKTKEVAEKTQQVADNVEEIKTAVNGRTAEMIAEIASLKAEVLALKEHNRTA